MSGSDELEVASPEFDTCRKIQDEWDGEEAGGNERTSTERPPLVGSEERAYIEWVISVLGRFRTVTRVSEAGI